MACTLDVKCRTVHLVSHPVFLGYEAGFQVRCHPWLGMHTYRLPRSCKEPASDLVKSTKEPVVKMANNAHAAVPFLVLALNTFCCTGLDPLVILHHLCCSSLGAKAKMRLKT